MGMPSEDLDGKLFVDASSNCFKFLVGTSEYYPQCRGQSVC